MTNKDFPLFDLTAGGPYVVVAGGGGNPLYGKENGILVFIKESVLRRMGTEPALYQTADIIKAVSVYVDVDAPEEFPLDRSCCEESADSTLINGSAVLANGSADSSIDDKAEAIASDKGGAGADDGIEAGPGSTGGPTAEIPDKVCAKQGVIYISAVGEEYFYLLRYDGEFTVILKERCVVKKAVLSRDLVLLIDSQVYGVHDVINNPGALSRALKAQNRKKGTHEEYFYTVFQQGDRLVFKREDGTLDIPADWDNFFVHRGRIHKVIFSKGKSTFVFNGEKREFEGRIGKIAVCNGVLAFYITLPEISHLHFIASQDSMFVLPRITGMDVFEKQAIVTTCTGDGIVYLEGAFFTQTHLDHLPITGISLEKKLCYYCTIDGVVSCAKIKRPFRLLEIAMAILLIAIAIAYGVFKK